MYICVNVGGVCKCVGCICGGVGGCARACGHMHVSVLVSVGVSVWLHVNVCAKCNFCRGVGTGPWGVWEGQERRYISRQQPWD